MVLYERGDALSERSQGFVAGLLVAMVLAGWQYEVGPLKWLHQYWPWESTDPRQSSLKAPKTATIKNYVVGCTDPNLLMVIGLGSSQTTEKQVREHPDQCAWITGEVAVVESSSSRARVRKKGDATEYWVRQSAMPSSYWPW
jgi:hypothetical protein